MSIIKKKTRGVALTLMILAAMFVSVTQATITTNITNLTSPVTHNVNESDSAIALPISMTWTAAVSTDATLSGYYYLFSQDATESTGDMLNGAQLGLTTNVDSSKDRQIVTDGNWYFHIMAYDNQGSFGSVKDYGPIVINTVPNVLSVVDSTGDSSGNNGSGQTLTISGSRFMDVVSVTVGGTNLSTVDRNSSTQITATVPLGFSTGTHDVKVANTAVLGKTNTLSSAYIVTASNTAPTAVAAVDGLSAPYSYTKTDATSTVTISLTGTDSTDTDASDTLTYIWSVDESPTDASDSSLSSTSSPTPTYPTDIAGNYIFGLIVSDGTVQSSKVQVTVTVNDQDNRPPTANAGVDLVVTMGGSAITLNGTASTDNETAETLGYAWLVTSQPGANALLALETTDQPRLSAYDEAGSYTIQLTVTDDSGLTDTDEVIITAQVGTFSGAVSTMMLNATDTVAGTDATSTFTATATPKDSNSNLLNSSGGGAGVFSSTNPAHTVSATTDVGNGTYTATVTSTTSGTGVISATVAGVAIDSTETISFTPAEHSVSNSQINADLGVAAADDTVIVSVTPEDQYGNTLAASQVTTVTISKDGSVYENATDSNSNGVYTKTFTMVDTTLLFTAKVNDVLIDATDSTLFSSSAPNVENSDVTDTTVAGTVVADASSTHTIQVTVKQQNLAVNGGALAGQTVSATSSDTSDTISVISATDSSGTTIFTVSSSVAGIKTITVVTGAGAEAVTLGTVDLTFVAGTASALTIKSGNNQNTIVGN